MNKEIQRKPVILIVDDDKQVLKSLKIWLKHEGFKPVIASTGDEATEILKKNRADVALVDYRLSKEDGVSVSQRLKEIDDALKIIMLTGFPSYETAVSAMKVGIFDYLSKGSSNDKILEVIRKAITQSDLKNTSTDPDSPSRENEVRLILFCHHSLLKEQLENYSGTRPGFKLIKSFPTLDIDGVKKISQHIDIALICGGCMMKTVKDAYTILPILYRLLPEIKPVIINDTFTDQEKVELLKVGIKGFSPPDFGSDALEEALIQVKKGEVWVSRNVIHLSLREMTNYTSSRMFKEKGEDSFDLSGRELEILKTIVLGLKNKDISEKLFISEKTVKTHINRIFRKLGVNSRAKAIYKAVEQKII